MKKNLLWFFGLAIMAATVFTTTSCEDDPCKDVECGANGTCSEGACVCNQGYEGTNCDVEWSAKSIGTWSVQDSVKGDATYLYASDITRLSEFKISVDNFGGFSGPNKVELELATAEGITAGTYTDAVGRVFTILDGSTYAANKITVKYKVSDGMTTSEAEAVFTK